MKLIEQILWKLTSRLPQRIIDEEGRPYLERYYVGTVFGYRFYLHRFVASDPDRGLHDHPWQRAYSIILSGTYTELTRIGPKQVKWFNTLTHDKFHRVLLSELKYEDMIIPNPCWSLFFHTKDNINKWGFLKPVSVDQDTQIFAPHKYVREGSQKDWWLKHNLRPNHVRYYDHSKLVARKS
jgi:hypothetical protein